MQSAGLNVVHVPACTVSIAPVGQCGVARTDHWLLYSRPDPAIARYSDETFPVRFPDGHYGATFAEG